MKRPRGCAGARPCIGRHLGVRPNDAWRVGSTAMKCIVALTVFLAACSAPRASTPTAPASSAPPATTTTPVPANESPEPTLDLQTMDGRILFGRAGGEWGDATIFTAGIDGTNDVRVGGFLADKTTCCPRWSPDGSRIAAVALAPDDRFTTVLMDADGSHPEVFGLPEKFSGGCTVWSPDGKRLACEAEMLGERGSHGVYTVSSNGGGDVQRVTRSAQVGLPLDFSPDGSQLLMLGEAVGARDPNIHQGAPLGSLYVVDVDGTDLHRITPDGVHAWSQARWSPDGQWIVFGTVGGDRGPLYLVRPDGTDLHEVFSATDDGPATLPNGLPTGSSSSSRSIPPVPNVTLSVAAPNRLCIVRADGTSLTCVVDSRDQKTWPDWTQ